MIIDELSEMPNLKPVDISSLTMYCIENNITDVVEIQKLINKYNTIQKIIIDLN